MEEATTMRPGRARPYRRALTVVVWLSLLAIVVLSVGSIDFSGARGSRPLWFLLLPLLSGLVGAAAGVLARRPVLGAVAAAAGFLFLPVIGVATTLIYGP